MEVLSNWLARLTVNQVPSGRAGSNPATSTMRRSRTEATVSGNCSKKGRRKPLGIEQW